MVKSKNILRIFHFILLALQYHHSYRSGFSARVIAPPPPPPAIKTNQYISKTCFYFKYFIRILHHSPSKTTDNGMLSNSEKRVNSLMASVTLQIIPNFFFTTVFCWLIIALICHVYMSFLAIEIVHEVQIYLNRIEFTNCSSPFLLFHCRRSSMASTEVSRASFTSSFWSIWSSNLPPRWRWDSAWPQDSCILYVRMSLTSTYMIVHRNYRHNFTVSF